MIIPQMHCSHPPPYLKDLDFSPLSPQWNPYFGPKSARKQIGIEKEDLAYNGVL